MIELYYWSTPNGHKVIIFLEEAELDYEIKPKNTLVLATNSNLNFYKSHLITGCQPLWTGSQPMVALPSQSLSQGQSCYI